MEYMRNNKLTESDLVIASSNGKIPDYFFLVYFAAS